MVQRRAVPGAGPAIENLWELERVSISYLIMWVLGFGLLKNVHLA